MLGIIIITYNKSCLINTQIQCIERFCKDPYRIVIVDNSTDPQEAEAIRYHTQAHTYIKTVPTSGNGSESHSFAANVSWNRFKDDFDTFFYLDHDCFPIRDFSIEEILGDKPLGGIGQQKSKLYFWPGCFMFRKQEEVDFSYSHEFGLDTGGNTWKLIDKYGIENCAFLDEVSYQNPYFNKSNYNYYSILGDKFLHFIGASNWQKSAHNQERINSLLNIVQGYL